MVNAFEILSYETLPITLYSRGTVFPAHIVITKHGNVSVATCLRCGFRAGARNLSILERTVQDHGCSKAYRGGERRTSRRWPVFLKAHCYARIGNAPCVIRDISESGMGVKSTLARKEGEEVTAAWRFARYDEAFRVKGVVRRASSDTLGIEFLDISVADRQRITRFLGAQTP